MARQPDHIRAEELISAYLDHRVTAEEKRFFEQHLATCADCRAQLEATRSMIAALRVMPVVKAPRSFVLPREMGKQPKRPVFNWYPALRLATVVAAMAFAILFASDLLIVRSGGGAANVVSIPAAAPAPRAMNDAAAQPTAAPAQPTQAPSQPQAFAPTAAAPAATAETQAPVAGAAAKSGTISSTATLSQPMVSALAAAATATPEVTAVGLQSQATSAPASAATEQIGPVGGRSAVSTPALPAIDPLRVVEIALLGLVVVLGVATLIARRRQL